MLMSFCTMKNSAMSWMPIQENMESSDKGRSLKGKTTASSNRLRKPSLIQCSKTGMSVPSPWTDFASLRWGWREQSSCEQADLDKRKASLKESYLHQGWIGVKIDKKEHEAEEDEVLLHPEKSKAYQSKRRKDLQKKMKYQSNRVGR